MEKEYRCRQGQPRLQRGNVASLLCYRNGLITDAKMHLTGSFQHV